MKASFALLFLLVGAGAVVAADPTFTKADRADRDNLQGTWKVESVRGLPKESSREEFEKVRLTFEGDQIHVRWGDKSAECTYRLAAAETPRQIDVTVTKGPEDVQGRLFRCLYLLEGNALRIAWRAAGEERPKELDPEGQAGVHEVFLKKVKP